MGSIDPSHPDRRVESFYEAENIRLEVNFDN